LGPCKKLVRIDLEADSVDKAFEEITRRYIRAVSLPGFRPGKAPRAMVEKKFSSDIEDEVKKKVLSDSYKQAMQEKAIRVVGTPDVEEIQFGRGLPLQFAVTVETEPELALPEYIGLPVALPAKAVTQGDVDRAIELLRERQAKVQTVHRAAQENDIVVVNYHGTCEGRPITEFAPAAKGLTEQKAFWIQAKPDAFIPGFGPQLVGSLAGDKRTVTVDFPADFVTPQVAGKQGVFEVEVVEVKEKIIPPLDDAFAKSYDAENVDALRAGVWRDLEKELVYQKARDTRTQVTQALLARVNCELPEHVVLRETRKIVFDIVEDNRKRGVDPDVINQSKDDIAGSANATAKDRVKLAFIFQKIAEKEGIKAQQQEVVERLHQLAARHEMSVDRLVKQLEKGAGISDIYEQIVNEKVMDLLVRSAKLEEIAVAAPPALAAPATAPA
jgi:trigger factor